MMLDITTRCTMGCKHCMDDCKPDGQDIDHDTLIKVLNFLKMNDLGKVLLISGGEPTEHNDFEGIIKSICEWNDVNRHIVVIIVTTNGEKMQDDGDTYIGLMNVCRLHDITLQYQVSTDARYYPRLIKTHKRVFRSPGVILVDNCVEHMYPQGRAKDNNLPWEAKAPKCYNVRAVSRQLPGCDLSVIESYLASRLKFCTPHISIHGEIKLGESCLCPTCATVEDSMQDIMYKIRRFKCHQCDEIFNTLPDEYKKLVE